MSALDDLAAAAERGVAVTIITNGYPAPDLRFKWHFEDKWWGAVGKFKAAGLEARVWDKDGDASEWELRRGKVVLAEGSTHECTPFYHFDACLIAAEEAFLAEVRKRRTVLQPPGSP